MLGTERAVSFDAEKVRRDFPFLDRRVHGKPLVYFDNAATSQKPLHVIDAICQYYREYNANVHRAVHVLSEEATAKYEGAREAVAKFVNAKSPREIVFVRGTTEAINLVAYSYCMNNLSRGDEVVSTLMEHHSNTVPWQFLQSRGVDLKFVDIDDEGRLNAGEYDELVTERTKLVTVSHVSNVLGTINPVQEIGRKAHSVGALFLVDAAQSVPHMPVDVQEIGCDFFAFSGHKMMAPTGIGVLYAKEELLEKMPPFMGGGDMIKEVRLREARWNDVPWKFEAGTPNIEGGIGLGAAIEYLERLGMERIRRHEKELTGYALEELSEVRGVKVHGHLDAEERGGVISFGIAGVHPHDIATILDAEGVAIRSGHHCAQPLMERLKVPATSRASFYVYNTAGEVDIFIKAIERVKSVFDV